jgi:uncharacterized radical SAM superfamily protein
MKKLLKKLMELQAMGYESVLISDGLEWIRFYAWETKTNKLNKQGED